MVNLLLWALVVIGYLNVVLFILLGRVNGGPWSVIVDMVIGAWALWLLAKGA